VADDSTTQEVAPYEWLLEGYRRSVGRFRDIAYEELPPSESFILLFEALNWAATIADRLGFGEKPNLLRALEYARNAVHHDWLLALTLTPRRFGEGAFGEGISAGRYGGGNRRNSLFLTGLIETANRSTAPCWWTDLLSTRFALWRNYYPSTRRGQTRNGH
jgi:hypothetical protein